MSGLINTLQPVILKVPPYQRFPRGRERVRALSRMAREAAKQSALLNGLTSMTFWKNDDGAPIPNNGVYWSITHKSDFVGGVVAEKPVGIDIEKKRETHPGLMEKIAGKKEWALVESRSDIIFYRFWTAKEAVLKAMGVGFNGLSNCRIVEIIDDIRLVATYKDNPFNVHQTWFTQTHIAAVTQDGLEKDQPISWQMV